MNYLDCMNRMQEEIAEIGLREVARRENIPPRIVEKVLDSDECPRCFRRLSRPYLTEQEVRSSTPALQRYMGELVICPTCRHYVLQRDEVTTDKELPMSERFDPHTGTPLVDPPDHPHPQQSPNPPQPPEHILQFFAYEHLPPNLQDISRPFCQLAHAIVLGDNAAEAGTVTTANGPLPRNPERTVALRHLLEAKDAAVRAVIAK